MAGKLARVTKRRFTPYTKFKAYMDEHGIKQADLAKLLNKDVSTVNQNLNGTGGDFSMNDVRLMCRTYGISSDTYFIDQKVS